MVGNHCTYAMYKQQCQHTQVLDDYAVVVIITMIVIIIITIITTTTIILIIIAITIVRMTLSSS